ncbi:MAG: sensor histidine kinase, partial [Ilumatobacteraceae bacterium]
GDETYRNDRARALRRTHSGVLIDEAVERHVGRALNGADTAEVIDFYGPPRQTVSVSCHRLPDGGVVAFIDDVTERRRIDTMRTDFVANISHELKTPVGAIAVLADALVDEDDPEVMARMVSRMVAEAERAARTIDDLLELSEIELSSPTDRVPLEPVDVLRAAADRLGQAAEQRSITIDIDAAVPDLVVVGDPRQLSSALGNLVDNAVKYSDDGARVRLRARTNDDWVELVVADDGVGIPERDLERIFERFYRVDKARSRGTGGTGLGLAIVRHVANNHGGDVLVHSTEGEGSTFVLRLPGAPRNPADTPDESVNDVLDPTPNPQQVDTR